MWRKILFSGRALLIVLLVGGLLGWGALLTLRSGLVWDASGLNLGEARALVAELPLESRIIVFGGSPLTPLFAPLARGDERLKLVHIGADQLPLLAGQRVSPKAGDIQVSAGRHWLLLSQPDLDTVLWSLALVASPYAPEPAMAPPSEGLTVRPEVSASGNLLTWVVTGVALPLVLSLAGLWWRRRRGGA